MGFYPTQEQLRPGNEQAHQYKMEEIEQFLKSCALNFPSHKDQLAKVRH
jgi:hypothetical protein